MFYIVTTHQNYFTCELLPDYNAAVKWHFTLCKLVSAMLGGKLFGVVVDYRRPVLPPVGSSQSLYSNKTKFNNYCYTYTTTVQL